MKGKLMEEEKDTDTEAPEDALDAKLAALDAKLDALDAKLDKLIEQADDRPGEDVLQKAWRKFADKQMVDAFDAAHEASRRAKDLTAERHELSPVELDRVKDKDYGSRSGPEPYDKRYQS